MVNFNPVSPKAYVKMAETVVKHTPKELNSFINQGVNAYSSSAASVGNQLQALSGLYVGALYVINTQINKNIPDERKPALHINNIFTSLFAFGVSQACFKKVDKLAGDFGKKHFTDERVAFLAEKFNLDKAINGKFFRKGLKFAAQTALITFAFRFLGPVFAGPVAQKIVGFAENKGWIKPKNPKTPDKAQDNAPLLAQKLKVETAQKDVIKTQKAK